MLLHPVADDGRAPSVSRVRGAKANPSEAIDAIEERHGFEVGVRDGFDRAIPFQKRLPDAVTRPGRPSPGSDEVVRAPSWTAEIEVEDGQFLVIGDVHIAAGEVAMAWSPFEWSRSRGELETEDLGNALEIGELV